MGHVDWQACEEASKATLASLVSFQREALYRIDADAVRRPCGRAFAAAGAHPPGRVQALLTSVLNCVDELQTSPADLFQLSTAQEPPNMPPPESMGKSVLKALFAQLGSLW
jgi:hypothetical protein